MSPSRFHRRANLSLGFLGAAAGLTLGIAGALSQSSGADIGQSVGILGALTGLVSAGLGIAWSRSKPQA